MMSCIVTYISWRFCSSVSDIALTCSSLNSSGLKRSQFHTPTCSSTYHWVISTGVGRVAVAHDGELQVLPRVALGFQAELPVRAGVQRDDVDVDADLGEVRLLLCLNCNSPF